MLKWIDRFSYHEAVVWSFSFTNVKTITIAAICFVNNSGLLWTINAVFVRKERFYASSTLKMIYKLTKECLAVSVFNDRGSSWVELITSFINSKNSFSRTIHHNYWVLRHTFSNLIQCNLCVSNWFISSTFFKMFSYLFLFFSSRKNGLWESLWSNNIIIEINGQVVVLRKYVSITLDCSTCRKFLFISESCFWARTLKFFWR